MLLDDEEIMKVLSNTHIEEFTGGDYAMWKSKLEWLQRQNIAKAQLKKVVEYIVELARARRTTSKHRVNYITISRRNWQDLLKGAE